MNPYQNPIQTMLHEHALISRSQEVIEGIKGTWLKDESGYKENVETLLMFFGEYADGFHHQKEEGVLFPILNRHPHFSLPGLIRELEMHHDEFREYARDIRDALENKDYSQSYDLLTRYMDDLLDHIAVENDELFVMVENLLDEEELVKLFMLFKDRDIEMGENRKRELEACIPQLLANLS